MVEDALDLESAEDVTSEYSMAIDTLIGFCHNRRNPVPVEHVVAVTDDKYLPGVVTIIVTVDTTDAVDDLVFDMIVEEDDLEAFDGGESDADSDVSVLDEFARRVRYAEEELWSEVVNVEE